MATSPIGSSGFAMSPVSRQPVTAPENFPRQLLFRWNGVDLGLADATTIDFTGTGFTVTRTGNTITVALS